MIGKNILAIRKKRGYSLSELAERAQISKSYLSNIERDLNQNPSIQVMKKIASVLNVDLKALLKAESIVETPQLQDKEWIDLAHELKASGIGKEQIKEYKTLIEFIKWQNKNIEKDKS